MASSQRTYPNASRVLVVMPGGIPHEFYDCEVRIRYSYQSVNLYRDGILLVTVPLDLCIIFWKDDAAAAVPAEKVRRPLRSTDEAT